MLIPARTDTKAFHEYIYGKAEIRFIKGRLKFGQSKNSAPFPSMVVIFDGEKKEGAKAMKTDRENLRDCPFCGARARMWQWGVSSHTVIECSNYDVDTHRVYMQGDTKEEAIEAWNRRAVEADGGENHC